MTLREAIAAGALSLSANAGLADNATRDAELLLLHQLGLSRSSLFSHPERPVSVEEMVAYDRALVRRMGNEPVQYITGEQEFYGLTLRVTPAVLIPRPETELLVEAVLAHLPAIRPQRILDVGTGSGAIAIALAVHRPLGQIEAVDISPQALSVARTNAETHHVLGRIKFVESDLVHSVAGERFDCIVSNPPYVPEADRESLQPQVRDFEPEEALFAGECGLDIYRRLIPEALTALVPGGLLALEIGYGQQAAIAALLLDWNDVRFEKDLQGIARVVLARSVV